MSDSNPSNPIKTLLTLGQSIWLDDLRRSYLQDGTLAKLIADGITGITTNPAIFEKAISSSDIYSADIKSLAKANKSIKDIYESLVIDDVQQAADMMRSVYDNSKKVDGYVSLEVSPNLANDAEGTIEEGRKLWAAVNRPNVFIKVPGTAEGLVAIEQLIADGININVTLLFSPTRYRQVIEAYWRGLEQRSNKGQPIADIASVASFFLSRIESSADTFIDKEIGSDSALRGTAALTAAGLAYDIFTKAFAENRWQALATKGAQIQRLLWASTGTKDNRYSDVKYIEECIGPNTVNTVPMPTLEAYLDHGQPQHRIQAIAQKSGQQNKALAAAGVDIEKIAQELEIDGIKKFVEPFDKLLKSIEARCSG